MIFTPQLPVFVLRHAAFLAAVLLPLAGHGEAMTREPEPVSSDPAGLLWHSRPGPWGDLEIRSLYLEAPEGRVDGLKHPSTTTGWNFPGGSEAMLHDLWVRAGLSEEIQARLMDPNRILLHEHVWTLFPEASIVAALTLEQRSVIYGELAKSTLNPMHESPAYVTGNRVEDWLHQAQLTEAQKDVVRSLLWKDGDLLAFSDVSVLLAQTTTDAEILHIFKFMTRVRALVVQRKLSAASDLRSLAAYW